MSRILQSLDSRFVGTDHSGKLLAKKGFRAGDNGSQIDYSSPSTVALFDDFFGPTLSGQWNAVETDVDATETILAGGIGGVLRIVSGNDDGNAVVLPDAAGITSALAWQASNGGLAMQARIKVSRITTAYLFVGFTDLVTIEAPVIASQTADGITTNASDAVGFMFDTGAATDTFFLVGVAADTDATTQVITAAPVADAYTTLRVEVSAAGVASFFKDGKQVGTAMTAAVTAATDLTPVVLVSNTDGTAAVNLDIDYVAVSANRGADGDAF